MSKFLLNYIIYDYINPLCLWIFRDLSTYFFNCNVEILIVPCVLNIPLSVGIVQQKINLAGIIASTDAVHVAEICATHIDQLAVIVVDSVRKLDRCFVLAIDAMLGQRAECLGVHRAAAYLPAGCCGGDLEFA